jgi:hypothetical protein
MADHDGRVRDGHDGHLKSLGEAGPTRIAKRVSQWRQQTIGRSWVGDHLVHLRRKGFIMGKKKKLKGLIEYRYVNSHANATYSLTEKGRLEAEELLNWIRGIYESFDPKWDVDPFA